MKFLFIFFLSFTTAYAQDQNSSSNESSFIDEVHQSFSSQIKSWGVSIDDMVLGLYGYFDDENETNALLHEGNASVTADVNLTLIFPAVIHTENNNSNLTRENIVREQTTDNNTSTKSQDTYLPQTINLLSLNTKQGDEIHVKEAKESFFVYKSMQLEDSPSLTQNINSKRPLIEKSLKHEQLKNAEKSIDEFFLTRKLLEERDKSYIRVSFLQANNSLGPDPFSFNVKARVHLTRSRKHLKLFIENFNDDSAKNIGKAGNEDSASIGLEQETNEFFGIQPRYSIGFRGIDPFVRARYSYEADFGDWHLKPVQTFQYSLEDEFSEITELFLDKPTSENTLLRFVVDRGTRSLDPGMHYDGFIQWFYKPRKKAGLSFNLGANGSTKYLNTMSEVPLLLKNENRVYNYLFLVRWRENIWKKWLFYEIGPGVNYHEQYDYRPNYNIFFGIDMFFGHV